MRMGGVSCLTCAVAPVPPLTLSSAVKASLFGIMSWRCLAQSEHGIARPRTWHALGGFRQCGTESQSNDALVRSASAIHSTADQGSVVTLVSLCRVGPGNCTPSLSQVGSRTGAPV